MESVVRKATLCFSTRMLRVINSLYSCNAAKDTWSDRRQEKIWFSFVMQERAELSYWRQKIVFRQTAADRVGVVWYTLRGHGWTDLGVLHQRSGLPLLVVHALAGRLWRELGTCAARRDAEATAVLQHDRAGAACWGMGAACFRLPQSRFNRMGCILRLRSEFPEAFSVHMHSLLSDELTGSPASRRTRHLCGIISPWNISHGTTKISWSIL
jgi:hypothetical protein